MRRFYFIFAALTLAACTAVETPEFVENEQVMQTGPEPAPQSDDPIAGDWPEFEVKRRSYDRNSRLRFGTGQSVLGDDGERRWILSEDDGFLGTRIQFGGGAEQPEFKVVLYRMSSFKFDNGCAPMPFGGSMFGPWDTGSGYQQP
jgi:hypothetical protein